MNNIAAIEKLSIPQQSELMDTAALGMPLVDCLLSMQIRTANAELLALKPEVIEIFELGRTQAQRKVRALLRAEAENGNVSAIGKLNLLDEPKKRKDEPLPPAVGVAPKHDVVKSVAEAF